MMHPQATLMEEVASSKKSFAESWPWPDKEMHIVGANRYSIRRTTEKFRSGRPKFMCIFYDNREMCTRDAMELTTKAGKPYYVVESGERRAERDAYTGSRRLTKLTFSQEDIGAPPEPIKLSSSPTV